MAPREARGGLVRRLPVGAAIVGWSTAVIVAIEGLIFAVAGTDADGVRMAVRATARTSVVLFSAAFAASSLFRLRRNEGTSWLLTNRRYFGLSFACSHAIHLAGILTLAFVFGQHFAPALVVVGGLAYVLLAAMAATSFDGAVAWLGSRRWQLLHKVGAYDLWLVFFLSYLPFRRPQLVPSAFFLLLLAAMYARWAAWRHSNLASIAARA